MSRLALGFWAVVGLLAVTTDGVAREAVGARLELFPSQPRAGQAATLQLRPFRTIGRKQVAAVLPAGTRWQVAVSRAGAMKAIRLRVSRDTENPYVWTGALRFRARGDWLVRIAGNPSASLRVHVLSPGTPSVWNRLQRPVAVPTIAPGSPCPTSAPDSRGDLSRIGGPHRLAWGTGPAYPSFRNGQADAPVLEFVKPIPRTSPLYGSGWFTSQVWWWFDRSANHDPMLIRGRQLDGMNEVRFDTEMGGAFRREMRIPAGQFLWPTDTRVRAAGCYAFQVDGTSFTSVIVFEAIGHPPS
jgi:hypothetical protein